jgi:hypothetical protein
VLPLPSLVNILVVDSSGVVCDVGNTAVAVTPVNPAPLPVNDPVNDPVAPANSACDPDTMTFFQVGMLFCLLSCFYINMLLFVKDQSNPTNNAFDVKYIAPFGAVPVNSTDEVAKITTPLCDTVNMA